MKYTIKCNRNGKLISSLFSDSLEETFQATSQNDAVVWSSLDDCMKVCDEINTVYEHDYLCSVIRVYE